MAEKRMFTQKIVESDEFLDMPLSAQALYFHLNMQADDDGFVNNPRSIQRMSGASVDDLKLLIAKRFIISFENCIVIKHWRMNNTLRKDRYKPTQYQKEYAQLTIKSNGSYTENAYGNQMATTWQPNGNQLATQYSIDKNSIDKYSIDKIREEENSTSQQVIDLFATLCPSYTPIQIISESMKKSIDSVLSSYTMDEITTLFKKAEASDFLKGKNTRNWSANFNWLINKDNIAKVLNGNFDNKKPKHTAYSLELFEQLLNADGADQPKTAADDESIRVRAEALQAQFAGK